MGLTTGLGLGLGLLLIFLSLFPRRRGLGHRWSQSLTDLLLNAGLRGVSGSGFVVTSVLVGALCGFAVLGVTRLVSVGVLATIGAGLVPLLIVRGRAAKNRLARRSAWPEVVEHLISAIGAGLALPEAVAQLETRGPALLRADFALFAQDYRASGRFDQSLVTLKARLADPVADRVIEALRITGSVGGSELGRLLRTLSEFLREEQKIRGELEARQSWTAGSAKVAAAAPWVVLGLLSTRSDTAAAFDTPLGLALLASAAVLTVGAYWLMLKIAQLPTDARVLR